MNLRIAFCLLLSLLAGCAHSPVDDPLDPLEPVNRKVFAFNNVVDKVVLRPAAQVYVTVTPQPVRTGVYNFLGNLFYPTVIINDFLQVKFLQGFEDAGRLLVNTTFGIFGLFDVADPFFGLERHDADLGQTLGYWGVGEGWFLMIPFLGPSTNRDLVGRIGDSAMDPFYRFVDDNDARVTALILSTVDGRARYLGTDKILDESFDPYAFLRGAYLQRREVRSYNNKPLPLYIRFPTTN